MKFRKHNLKTQDERDADKLFKKESNTADIFLYWCGAILGVVVLICYLTMGI